METHGDSFISQFKARVSESEKGYNKMRGEKAMMKCIEWAFRGERERVRKFEPFLGSNGQSL
jgi:hypothetical protein